MWIVRLALRRPYTFVVASLLILIVGMVSIVRTPTDIFPNIDIPVISVLWNYNGLAPEDMTDRIVSGYERYLTTTVNNIEHTESQTLTGISVVKIYFQPNTDIIGTLPSRRCRLFRRPLSAKCPRARLRLSRSCTTLPRCPFCSWLSKAIISTSSKSTTWA